MAAKISALIATPTTACLAGIYSGVAGYFLTPWIDYGGTYGLLLGFVLVIFPAYPFVFGMEKRKVGRWALDVKVLKRGGAWFLGVVGIGTVLQLLQILVYGLPS